MFAGHFKWWFPKARSLADQLNHFKLIAIALHTLHPFHNGFVLIFKYYII